ncbi:LysR family transcriptional regulator [Dongshaea marina]|uniref:LysR family transcriptional regulator n=1 Tax=Dongshaea marina TaxID=2047966 RepID=UPI00131EEC92|nr:LysR family transcriptional regulator [Dongshaea marina]
MSKSLIVFAHVADLKSFTKAARLLGVTNSTVTEHIKKLESKCGLTLINRTSQKFSLTSSGESYYRYCLQISATVDKTWDLMERVTAEPEGKLTLYSPVALGEKILLPLLEKFRVIYPKIKLDIRLSDNEPDLIQDSVDVAVRHRPMKALDIYTKTLGEFERYFCASPNYIIKNGEPASIEDLINHCVISYKGDMNQFDADIICDCAITRSFFVLHGHGVANLPDYEAIPLIRSGKLMHVIKDHHEPPSTLYLAYPKGDKDAKKNQLIIDFITHNFRDEVERYKLDSVNRPALVS